MNGRTGMGGSPPLEGAVLSARDVTREFTSGGQTFRAVNGVNLDLYPGEFAVLMGRSGSGKTTLLNLLGGLDRPSGGAVYFEGQDVSRLPGRVMTSLRRQKLGFIFQTFGLLPLLSAYENVELPLRIAGMGRAARDARTKEALEMVGVAHRMRHRPYELSGGEQQRVAIARAIVHKPALILADEPTAELDSVTARAVFSLLREIVRLEPVAVLAATHDRNAVSNAHRVLLIVDGTLVEEERPKRVPSTRG